MFFKASQNVRQNYCLLSKTPPGYTVMMYCLFLRLEIWRRTMKLLIARRNGIYKIAMNNEFPSVSYPWYCVISVDICINIWTDAKGRLKSNPIFNAVRLVVLDKSGQKLKLKHFPLVLNVCGTTKNARESQRIRS